MKITTNMCHKRRDPGRDKRFLPFLHTFVNLKKKHYLAKKWDGIGEFPIDYYLIR